jgi:uncharacterized membrane protein YdjX (TVP38/TMEM64 family)
MVFNGLQRGDDGSFYTDTKLPDSGDTEHISAEPGYWAPVVYIILYTVDVCPFLPGALLTGLGASYSRTELGFVYVWVAGAHSSPKIFSEKVQ